MTSDPIRALAVSYAPRPARPAVAALLTLDETLAAVLRSTREPLLGQMRLTWWNEQLRALDDGPPPVDQPVLAHLGAAIARGATGAKLATMIDGWEVVLEPEPPNNASLLRYATARGAGLFAAIASVCAVSASDPIAIGGEGWALADLARNVADPALRLRAHALAQPRLAVATRWSRPGRALGALIHATNGERRAPTLRLARLVWHRFTGR